MSGSHHRVPAFAAAAIPAGTFVRLDGDQAHPDPTLVGPGGVVALTRGSEIEAGAPVDEQTDGGILAAISAPAVLTIRGAPTSFGAGTNRYLHLSAGRVVGFQGDGSASA